MCTFGPTPLMIEMHPHHVFRHGRTGVCLWLARDTAVSHRLHASAACRAKLARPTSQFTDFRVPAQPRTALLSRLHTLEYAALKGLYVRDCEENQSVEWLLTAATRLTLPLELCHPDLLSLLSSS